MITIVYLVAKTAQSDRALPIRLPTASTTLFFFAANEKDNLCTCCSGNVFPTGRYVGSMIILNQMADTVDRQRSTSRGS